MVDVDDWRKVFTLGKQLGCVYSGLGADARLLARRGRKEAEVYRRQYDENIPTKQAARKLGDIAQDFTQSGGVRPFGVSLLMAGYDKVRGPSLYQVDPSGAWWEWKASAIGKNQTTAKNFLEKRFVFFIVVIIFISCLFVCLFLVFCIILAH